MRFFLGLAAVVAITLSGTTAQAGFINGSATFFTTTQDRFSGTVLTTRNITNVSLAGGSLDFNQVNAATWQSFVLTDPMAAGGVFSLSTSAFGTFTSTTLTSDSGSSGIVNGSGNRTIFYAGGFAAGTLFSADVRDLSDANLTITIVQNTTQFYTEVSTFATLTASGSGPAAVPEPTSIAIFGLGALGMVARRRFRRK